ncbi:MAG: hypothetical protein M3082_02445 [Candidatus Dormibacteraeota bacterium]|nr:hypothetical protein [Candidatus Dormibacteraeota bacterium]
MRKVLLVVILMSTAACAGYRFPGSENGSGTVSGQVIATGCGPGPAAATVPGGPADQPCIADPGPACGAKPSNQPVCGGWPVAGLELVFTNEGSSVTAKTDSGGAYSIQLRAGTWAVSTGSMVRILSGPQTLVVGAGASIVANYVVDTGMRTPTGSQSGFATAAPSMGPG